jgi:hypothetical protein
MSSPADDSERKWWQGSVEFKKSKREQSQSDSSEKRDQATQATDKADLNVSRLSGWYRLWVVLSCIWILFIYIAFEVWEYPGNQKEFILIGVLPILIFWGSIWIYKGFRSNKKI